MVDAWTAAPAAQREGVFHAAFAVRQIEIGLASMVSLSMGLTAAMYGEALLVDQTYPKWVGGLALIGGVPTMVAGVVIAYTGFLDWRWRSICRRTSSSSCGCSPLECSCGAEAESRWMKRRSDNRLEIAPPGTK